MFRTATTFNKLPITLDLAALRREIIAGITVACATVPICMTAGVLVYTPLGGSNIAQGAVAGLYGAVIAGIVAALLASNSFIITAPAVSISIIPAALGASLVGKNEFAAHPHWIVASIALCILLAGILQVLFGLLNIGRIIKFTPHPVVAGFINSVAMVILIGQLRPFFAFGANGHWVSINRPTMFVFVIALSALMIFWGTLSKKVPAPIAGLVIGTALFYLLKIISSHLELGPTLGRLPVTLTSLPLVDLRDVGMRSALVSVAPQLLLSSLTLATVVTLQSLLSFRAAQNLADLRLRPARDVISQGVTNCVGAATAGLMSYPSPALSSACFKAGGRTRIAGITSALLIFLVPIFLSAVLAIIPVAVLRAILLAIGITMVDRWSLRLVGDVIKNRPGFDRRQEWQGLFVVALVILVTAFSSIVAGAIAGFMLSCAIFIVRMSRPIVRSRYRGDQLFSKRVRSADDTATLRRTGSRRVVLELQGVLFFGNAEDLSSILKELSQDSDMILLDLRGISDIDVSGATILADAVSRCRAHGNRVLFCNVPAARFNVATFAGRADAVLPDLDTALEWMEEAALRATAEARSPHQAIPLAALDLFKDFDASELAVVRAQLIPRDFTAGALVCSEGEDADRMWILTKGSVSVRLRSALRQDERRIASMAAGTTVGEMALLEGGQRSATVVCDENVSCYELSRTAFDAIQRDHPQVARKLFTYFAREMVQRVRVLHQDLRTLAG